MGSRVFDRIMALGIIPVVRAPSGDLAVRAVEAICAGGIDVIELTMTVPGAVTLIRELTTRFGDDVVIGAGTVLDAETARACIVAGAAFVVSPILDPPMIACCGTYGVPVIPGALTPTEVVRAAQAGADMIKVFPCGAVGGPSYVRSLMGPLPHLRLVPTGGVSLENVGDFFRAGATAVGVGTDLVDVGKIADGGADAVTQTARRYLDTIKQARTSASNRRSGVHGT
jgi:2-dehydro-3-deoxyphosphogluconate aldolase/(4S)-4-hydroxy-2-oxoglutarate aldolase